MTRLTTEPTRHRKLTAVVLTAAMVLLGLSSPTSAEPQGYIEAPLGVGYFYGTFGQTPEIQLLVGGTAEDFCDDKPEDPFNGEPGTAFGRIFLRNDGSEDIKVNSKDQPIFLYYGDGDGPTWINGVCADEIEPRLFAEGHADLKVRVSVLASADLVVVDVFNSVNGKATGTDGTEYKVRASADLVVENGVPVGDPADFVSFSLKEIKR